MCLEKCALSKQWATCPGTRASMDFLGIKMSVFTPAARCRHPSTRTSATCAEKVPKRPAQSTRSPFLPVAESVSPRYSPSVATTPSVPKSLGDQKPGPFVRLIECVSGHVSRDLDLTLRTPSKLTFMLITSGLVILELIQLTTAAVYTRRYDSFHENLAALLGYALVCYPWCFWLGVSGAHRENVAKILLATGFWVLTWAEIVLRLFGFRICLWSQYNLCLFFLTLSTVFTTCLTILAWILIRRLGWRAFYSLGSTIRFRHALIAYQTLVAAVAWSLVACLCLAYLSLVRLGFHGDPDCVKNFVPLFVISGFVMFTDQIALRFLTHSRYRSFSAAVAIGFLAIVVIVASAAPNRSFGRLPLLWASETSQAYIESLFASLIWHLILSRVLMVVSAFLIRLKYQHIVPDIVQGFDRWGERLSISNTPDFGDSSPDTHMRFGGSSPFSQSLSFRRAGSTSAEPTPALRARATLHETKIVRSSVMRPPFMPPLVGAGVTVTSHPQPSSVPESINSMLTVWHDKTAPSSF